MNLLRLPLYIQIFLAMMLAIPVGMFLTPILPYIDWMGTLFLNSLKLVVVPLVFTSLIKGMLTIQGENGLGKLGIKTIFYYLTTSLLAILTGLLLVNIIQPGSGNVQFELTDFDTESLQKNSVKDTILGIVPNNIFHAFLDANMLSIIFLAILFGVFLNKYNGVGKSSLHNVIIACFEIIMKITLFFIRFAPLGIFSLIAVEISKHDNIMHLFDQLGKFVFTVVLGLAVHFFVNIPLVLKFIGKVNPWLHLKNMVTPLFTAFSTASSSSTLPLTMQAVEERNGVSNKIASFTLPLGATINMDGTALYELVVAGFIAQLYGIELTFGEQFILVFTALLASIGTAAVPMASLVTMTIIFSALGLPLEAIAIILPVDRILDMFRTTTNVWSDSAGATIIAKSEGETLLV